METKYEESKVEKLMNKTFFFLFQSYCFHNFHDTSI